MLSSCSRTTPKLWWGVICDQVPSWLSTQLLLPPPHSVFHPHWHAVVPSSCFLVPLLGTNTLPCILPQLDRLSSRSQWNCHLHSKAWALPKKIKHTLILHLISLSYLSWPIYYNLFFGRINNPLLYFVHYPSKMRAPWQQDPVFLWGSLDLAQGKSLNTWLS